jgi:hypothetical protein
MAKGISSGIGQQAARQKSETEKQTEQHSKQWKEFRNRIDIILMSNNVMKTNEVRVKCSALDGMTPKEREDHIVLHWGPLYLQKVEPLLQQLQILEQHIAAAQPPA